MDTRTLKISRPCPIDLDADRSGRQFFCHHCQKDVHVLANWPRAEAEAFLAANRGRSVCVSLRRDADGELQYADSPARPRPPALVPVTRLRRRWLPEAAAAAGVAAVLSACTPRGPVKGSEKLASEDEILMRPAEGGVDAPHAIEPPTPPSTVEDELDPGPMLKGELDPAPRIERGEKPATTPPPAARRPRAPTRAPEPKAAKEPELQEFDGGIDL
ncbi:hypothetical protein SAMN02745121_03761 [Nannocystis exedens]|uniref:Uncharacterized protein n=1 Tax=Nannocystis exedens TaxID=54 RepID=A0A1I1ZG97_9BACT|nr:hypothetical protein [Nannocystis exedens]PCC75034.1 hypothetical protein NAEX_08137 [Nannocystis exedens]SFE29583.1 hypothetical protein SAMN02745121_03761 [Nannocystis exedens]